jgi:hypothetical protein
MGNEVERDMGLGGDYQKSEGKFIHIRNWLNEVMTRGV